MALWGGSSSASFSNGVACRTIQNTPPETTQKKLSVSNRDHGLSEAVKFVLKCIAALDEYEVEELAYEISPDNADELTTQMMDEALVTREAFGGGALFAQVAEEYRRNRPTNRGDDECELPDFDDPDFLSKLHTESAPLADRKRLFVRLWGDFDIADKRAFLVRVDPNGAFQRVVS